MSESMFELHESSTVEELNALPYWEPNERILSSTSAGESNMNLVLRLMTTHRSLILKQSKPYVRKYPQIPAPIERIITEHRFLKLTSDQPELSSFVARVLHFDQENHLLLMEDLGQGRDFMGLYSGEKTITESDLDKLVDFLRNLHALQISDFPDNLALRHLNHEHIFVFPFREDNGLDLDLIQPGLQALSMPYRKDSRLSQTLINLGKRYLSEGKTLIHGDFYPGSWLEVPAGLKIIDPEFGFLGEAEFDLGVFLAHLDLAGCSSDLEKRLFRYELPFDKDLVNSYRGAEILRRLLGIAQLPVRLDLSQKDSLLQKAYRYLLPQS